MSTDLEQRIKTLASAWDHQAPAIAPDEIVRHPCPEIGDISDAVTSEARPSRLDPRRVVAMAAALLVAVAGIIVLVNRSANQADPESPATSEPPATAAPVVETTELATPSTSPSASTDPTDAPTTEPPSTLPTTTSVPVALDPEEVTSRLAAIDAERRDALRAFTTIGFTVERTQELPDGAPYEGGVGQGPAHVVLRNDGSAAVVSESFGLSYYDAVTGTARAGYVDASGAPAYQELAGLGDGSVPLGIPTGLANGIVTRLDVLSQGVVAIEEDVVDGRATWRIDQRHEAFGPGMPAAELSTWIDRATGITVQTRSSGSMAIGDGDDMTPITETITLSDLAPNEPLPVDFPNPFPADAQPALSGDPNQFGPTTIEAGVAELGAPVAVPTLVADQISIQRMTYFTDDGESTVNASLVLRWFDGFVVTEMQINRLPLAPGATSADCVDCASALLEQLRAAPIGLSGISVNVGPFLVSITGDPSRIAEIVASLVTTG